MFDSHEFKSLLYKILNDVKFMSIPDRFARMYHIVIRRNRQITQFGEQVLLKCKNHESKHQKSVLKAGEILKKIRNQNDLMKSLSAYDEAIRLLPYDWSHWDQMFKLMMTFTQRARILFELQCYCEAHSDLKHVSSILANFQDQTAMMLHFKNNIDSLSLIISLKLHLVKHIDTDNVSKWFHEWLTLFNIYQKISDIVQPNIDLMKNILTKLNVPTLFAILHKFDEQFSHFDKHGNNEKESNNFVNYIMNEKLSLSYCEKNGRQFFSKNHIVKNEILIQERPMFFVLFPENTRKYCSFCGQLLITSWPCSGCDEIVFCSSQCCQRAFDLYHRYECKIYGLLIGSYNYYSIIYVFRLFCIFGKYWQQCEQDVKENFDSNNPQDWINQYLNNEKLRTKWMDQWDEEDRRQACQAITSLLHHRGYRDRMRESCLTTFSFVLIYCFIYKNIYEKSLIKDLHKFSTLAEHLSVAMVRFATNGFCWTECKLKETKSKNTNQTMEVNKVGSCICFIASFFNHNCNPNVFWSFYNNGIQLKALRSIKPGEALTISYGPNRAIDFNQRQFRLKEDYCFFCQCRLCQMDASRMTNVMRCLASKNCPGALVLNKYESCLLCGQRPDNLTQTHQMCSKMKKSARKLLKTLQSINKDIKKAINEGHYEDSKVKIFFKKLLGFDHRKKIIRTHCLNFCPVTINEKKLLLMEKYFNSYRSMVYGGSYHLLNICILLIYVYNYTGLNTQIFWLIDTIDHCLDHIFPELIDPELVPLIVKIDYLCKFFEYFLKSNIDTNDNQSIREYIWALIVNLSRNLINQTSDNDYNPFEKPIVLHSKFWCLIQKMNRILYEILHYDLHQRGFLFPKLFAELGQQYKSDEYSITLNSESENIIIENPKEVESFQSLKLDADERYFKKMYEDCQRRLSEIDQLLDN